MAQSIYVLGGAQSDFALNWQRQDKTLFDGFKETVQQGLTDAQLDPKDVQVGHVGNFVADLFTGQAQLGGFFGHVDEALRYLPASRHEAACASGSMALLAAMTDLESGRYDLACVVGVEMMRNVSSSDAANYLRPAAWADKEWLDTPFVWPCAFDNLIDLYQQRYGVDTGYLRAISQKNYTNGQLNPNAQCRKWHFDDDSFEDNSELNPQVSGRIRKLDCGQLTDGAAVVFLASEERARDYAKARGIPLSTIPTITGWGHINAPMLFAEKVALAEGQDYIFPHVHKVIQQTLARAGLTQVSQLSGLEVHDCFNITEYMILDHCGLESPGDIWKKIEDDAFALNGELPVNASGGLIGQGHPVGATGVRMLLDGYRQVSGQADSFQIEGAEHVMTLNLGGSATTCASFIVSKGQ
jgi:acetyl-CoA C-acetyltransferase